MSKYSRTIRYTFQTARKEENGAITTRFGLLGNECITTQQNQKFISDALVSCGIK